MYKSIMLLLVFLHLYVSTFSASVTRSDSIDIRKTIIHFSALDFSSKQITAVAQLDIKAKVNNLSHVLFDLEGLIVDSVKINNVTQNFISISPVLDIQLNSALQINDTAVIDVYYQGIPIADATWGGFSFVGNYGFQMGVGFNAQPHSFGRTWHPCFDNFVERCAYEYYVTTTDTKKAMCNGLMIDSVLNANNTITWHWKLNEDIPSYLASVAICNYVIVTQNLTGNNGNVLAEIACEPADLAKVNGSFLHLQQSFSMLENRFGTYSWPKVGYTLVPFNAGAMEHATNIHIGLPFVDGTLNYETLIAHELSHHWWGNLATCSTAGDMWLNEGFASYCEFLHQEYTYGFEAYQKAVRDNHLQVLSNAHFNDDGYRAISNMDSTHTYGTTVYLKGADAIHTLRTYLGDNDFFAGTKAFLNANKFKDVSTITLRDFLSTYTGKNLNNYFTNWIQAPGFTNFTIDSIDVVPTGNQFNVSVFIRQRKHKSLDYYSDVPLQIGFYENMYNRQIVDFTFSGRCIKLNVTLPFEPQMTLIDPDFKLSDATTEDWKTIKTIGTTNMTYAKCKILAKTIPTAGDSATVRVEHHWVAADRFRNQTNANGYVLNTSRYWKVDGIDLNKIKAWILFTYDGTANNNYLDSTWIKNTEDSIQLFFRKDAREEWLALNDSLVTGSLTDKVGNVYYKELKAGEYCLGIKRSNYTDIIQTDAPLGGCGIVTSIEDQILKIAQQFSIFPNPNQGNFTLTFQKAVNHPTIELFDLVGNHIAFTMREINDTQYSILLNNFAKGIYYLKVKNWVQKFVVE
jgi:hypothetical protein